MIYLIETTYYNKETKEILDLLKIGYTKDIDSRIDSYYLHNPECRLLQTREGGTELESYFHSLYNKYSYPKRREWFYYSQEIVDNFQSISLEDRDLMEKEDYIVGLREYLKSEVPGIQELKSKYLDSLLREIEELSITKGLEELYDKDFHRSLTLDIWETGYNKEISFLESYNFEELLRDFPEKINIQENPWKNSATFYYRSTANYREMKAKDFQKIIDSKKDSTEKLLKAFDSVPYDTKFELAKTYKTVAITQNYKENYVAVNKIHTSEGNIILKPIPNNLVLVNEIRAFKIQQIDYRDRFSVFSTVHNTLTPDDIVNQEVSEFLRTYIGLNTIYDKLKLLCEYGLSQDAIQIVLGQINDSDEIKSYYTALEPQKLKALSYNSTNIKKYLGIVTFSQELLESTINSEFKVGDKLTLASIKDRLGYLYSSIGYDKTPKATDLENYFEVKKCTINFPGKRVNGLEIIKKKG